MERNPLILTSLGIFLVTWTHGVDAATSISRQEWQKIVQPHRSETYLVAEGETLKSISKKLFGNEKYWSKILEINQSSITNPEQLDPGTILIFSSATQEPSKRNLGRTKGRATSPTGPQKTSKNKYIPPSTDPLDEESKNRPAEWKGLPKQRWESDIAIDLSHLDQNNFDLRSTTLRSRGLTSYEPHFIPASEKLPSLGRIIGGQASSHYFMLYDLVFIKAADHMKIGDIYAITQEPIWISNGSLTNGGYAYYILGKVKIIGVQENVFLGSIIESKHLVARTNTLIPVPAKIPEMNPIPGPKPLSARLLLNREYTEGITVQNREVFIDHGTEDGVQPGMIFRAYLNSDPNNDGSLPDSDFVINADILVTQVSEGFSSGMIIYSRNMIKHGSRIVLLTDVSDVSKHLGFSQRGGDGVDEIDLLDSRNTPDNKEAEEIKQLENWKGNPVPPQDQKKLRAILEKTAEEKDLPSPQSLKSPIPNPDPLPLLQDKAQLPSDQNTKSDSPSHSTPDSSSLLGTPPAPSTEITPEPVAPIPPSPPTPGLKGASAPTNTDSLGPSRDLSSINSNTTPDFTQTPTPPSQVTPPQPQAAAPPSSAVTIPLTPVAPPSPASALPTTAAPDSTTTSLPPTSALPPQAPSSTPPLSPPAADAPPPKI